MKGFTHIDLGGNCKFLYRDTADEIKMVINDIINNQKVYEKMKSVATNRGMDIFSYRKIAQDSIKDE